jgi:uncharacterized membrane protein
MQEKRYRSIVKGITWRIVATIDTFFISWLITRQIKFAISISLVEVITKLLLYYLHERAWNKIHFGKKFDAPEYHI